MRRVPLLLAAVTAILTAVNPATPVSANDDDLTGQRILRATLLASNELPIVISPARGSFQAVVDRSGPEPVLRWRLTYGRLEGAVTQAHIHASQPGFNGGIMIWLCGTASAPGPAGTPTCPAVPMDGSQATVEGESDAADVVGPTSQAIPAGNFADALEAILGGNAYANVHSTVSGAGELRGQIR